MESFRTNTVYLREAKIAKDMWGEKYQRKLCVRRTAYDTSRSRADVLESIGSTWELLVTLGTERWIQSPGHDGC